MFGTCPLTSKTPMKISEVAGCGEGKLSCACSWKTSKISARASNSCSWWYCDRAEQLGVACAAILPRNQDFLVKVASHCAVPRGRNMKAQAFGLCPCVPPVQSAWAAQGKGAVSTMERGKGPIRREMGE